MYDDAIRYKYLSFINCYSRRLLLTCPRTTSLAPNQMQEYVDDGRREQNPNRNHRGVNRQIHFRVFNFQANQYLGRNLQQNSRYVPAMGR